MSMQISLSGLKRGWQKSNWLCHCLVLLL